MFIYDPCGHSDGSTEISHWQQIVGLIMFTNKEDLGGIIDCIIVDNGYRNESLGCLLVHLVNLYVKQNIYKENNKLFLKCGRRNVQYLKDMGFKKFLFTESKKNQIVKHSQS